MYLDLVTWIPIVFIVDCSKSQFFRLFYLVKVLRISKAIEKFDVMFIMNQIQIFTKLNKDKEIK